MQLLLQDYSGRPTPLYFAERLSNQLGGARIFLKREDLNHTGAHKINNTIGQGLLAKKMGKKKSSRKPEPDSTVLRQRRFAPCWVWNARFSWEKKIFADKKLNVYRMRMLGAEVVPVTSGSRTLKDAGNETMRYWVANVEDTFMLFGTAAGPHPYPYMVREFQKVIGEETREQALTNMGRLPDTVIACVGGGSNAIGMFHPFIDDSQVTLMGVEAGGRGIESGAHAATLSQGTPGVFQGSYSYVLQDIHGQVKEAHSISAGLDYPGVGPEHAFLRDSGRVRYCSITDQEALDALYLLSRTEGIIPALESSHAVAQAVKLAPECSSEHIMVVCLSGRGDKDVEAIAGYEGGGLQ
ncbi:tryptophan synthase subunit beta [Paenibacillus hexagrammi]|uniref:Tryptophan synthase beta chain n=1 Tax=Paenibacillus hexagrammi TaxID=2908839 RepID=A0ABY3SQV4_9BACL|nr:tryptophan synthase subunit beta [Paenibacillus sp. YPD9-1]UJF36374.1 tryptophan synthase subunit beta [Paenibacillus sp. YPD9-1]